MNNSTVINYAILMVNDEENKDYYDNFVTLIAECIRRSSNTIISTNEVQDDLKSLFGINLPISVINTILRRRLTKKGYVKYFEKKYIPNRESLERLDFITKQQAVLEQHAKLINELLLFSNKYPDLKWSKQTAEEALEQYLRKNNILLMNFKKQERHDSQENNDTNKGPVYIVGQFIKNLDIDSIEYRYLESIIKGDMLASAIYYTDPAHAGMKFQNSTEIYFDTSFLIYALGYAGTARQAPCLELIELLKGTNAVLRCFKHTINEIIGILEGCGHRLKVGNLVDNHGTMEYFIANKYTSTDIERLIFGLENEIQQKLKIRILDTPPYIEKYIIDEKSLTETLSKSIRYLKDNALDKDVSSISAIMRLRKHHTSMFVEDCRSVFVTTNYKLSEVSRKFFQEEFKNNRIIPPVLPDYVLTNLLWLKNPTEAPSLTRKRIIADCIAATMPQEYVWKRYFEKIEQINKDNKITSDDYYILRYSQEARSAMMEITHGDGDVITIGTIQEILTVSKAEMAKEFQLITEQKENEKKALEREYRKFTKETAAANELTISRIDITAKKYAAIIMKCLKVLLVILLLSGQTFAYYMLNFHISLWIHIPIVTLFVSFFPVSGYMGLSLLRPFQSLEIRIEQMIKSRLNSIIEVHKQAA